MSHPMDMIRPHHIAQIPTLNDQQKAHWKEGLTKLWATVDNPSADADTKQKAITKIKDVSKDLMMNIAKWKATQGQQAGRPPSQGQQPQSQPQQPQQQQPQGQSQIQNQAQQQQPQPQQQQQQQTQPQQAQQQGQGQSQPYQMSDNALNFLRNYTVYPPSNMNTNSQEWTDHKTRAVRMMQTAIMQQDKAAQRLQHLNRRKQNHQQQGQEPPADLIQALTETETTMMQAKTHVQRIRTDNERNREAYTARNKDGAQNSAGGDAGSPNGVVSQVQMPNQMQAQQQVRQQQSQNQTQAMYNAAVAGNSQNQQPSGPLAMSPSAGTPQGFQPQTQSAMQNQPQPPQQQQQQSAMPMTQQQQQQQPSAGMPGRPLPNPQQAYAQQQQSHQTPTTPMNTNNPQGPPQALSHQAAMSAAARTYSEQAARTTTPVATTPGASFPSIGNAINNPNAKMPIPKTLNIQSPAPVAMGPARPTFGGGAPQNMMGQPAIPKPPGFELEGGERVLSKKKLDELVRQVTGGGENDALTPDVEEALLSVTDDFVDTLITSACRLAKIRPNSTLDIRDVQIVLERNYNIRVPGYSLDEVRTVRKFQPAQGWTQKMNAVQAAKVMGKNDS